MATEPARGAGGLRGTPIRSPGGVLVFDAGGGSYAVAATDVVEIARSVTVVPLPKAPAIVEGIINFRGTVVPVLDLRSRFRLPAKPPEHTDHLVIARAGERLVALRVDRARELARLDPGLVADVREVVLGTDYVAGVGLLPDGLVLIHDLATFLSQAEGRALDEALSEPGVTSGGS